MFSFDDVIMLKRSVIVPILFIFDTLGPDRIVGILQRNIIKLNMKYIAMHSKRKVKVSPEQDGVGQLL